MNQEKNNMITRLRQVLLEQGLEVREDFEAQASKLSISQLAIEISLAQAGID